MLKQISVAILSTLVVLFLWNSQSSFAQPFEDDDLGPPQGQQMGMNRGSGGEMRHKGGPEGMKNFMKELNLTEEQKATLKAKREAAKTEIDAIRAQMKPEMEKMMDLMHSPNSTKQQVYAQIDKVGSLKTQMHKIRAGNLIELKEILTPEQKTKLQEIVAKKKEQMKQRGENGPGQRFKKFRNKNNN